MWAGSLLSLSFAAGLLASSEGSPAPVAVEPLPDLIIWGPFTNPHIVTRNFDEDDCALDPFDPCIGAAGTRRLLRFGTETRNVGTADLVIGDPDPGPTGPPDLHPFYEWFECRDHPVLRKFDEFRLVDCYGYVYARSFKSVFCMVDSVYRGAAPSPGGQYHCGNQGIQVDFADLYYSTLPCQWLDITNLPPDDYVLEMETNAQRIIPELNFDNNITVVPVTISSVGPDDPDPVTPINGQSVATHTPTFQFTPFTNSNDSATQAGYQIQVRRLDDNGNDCDTIVYDTGFISDTSGTTHTYQPGAFSGNDPALSTPPRLSEPLACETLYTWAVRYRDTNGDWSHWSDDGTTTATWAVTWAVTTHPTDTNRDFKITLFEFLGHAGPVAAVFQQGASGEYNFNGTTLAPRSSATGHAPITIHPADTDSDFSISLFEYLSFAGPVAAVFQEGVNGGDYDWDGTELTPVRNQ